VSTNALCVNNLTNVVTYQWDGWEVGGLAKGLAECLWSGHSASTKQTDSKHNRLLL